MTARRGTAPAKTPSRPFEAVYAAISEYDEAEIAAGIDSVKARMKGAISFDALIASVLRECESRQHAAVSAVCEAAFATSANMTPTGAKERAEWQQRALEGRQDVEARQLSREQRLERERLARWQSGQATMKQAAVPTQSRARAFCSRMAAIAA